VHALQVLALQAASNRPRAALDSVLFRDFDAKLLGSVAAFMLLERLVYRSVNFFGLSIAGGPFRKGVKPAIRNVKNTAHGYDFKNVPVLMDEFEAGYFGLAK